MWSTFWLIFWSEQDYLTEYKDDYNIYTYIYTKKWLCLELVCAIACTESIFLGSFWNQNSDSDQLGSCGLYTPDFTTLANRCCILGLRKALHMVNTALPSVALLQLGTVLKGNGSVIEPLLGMQKISSLGFQAKDFHSTAWVDNTDFHDSWSDSV